MVNKVLLLKKFGGIVLPVEMQPDSAPQQWL